MLSLARGWDSLGVICATTPYAQPRGSVKALTGSWLGYIGVASQKLGEDIRCSWGPSDIRPSSMFRTCPKGVTSPWSLCSRPRTAEEGLYARLPGFLSSAAKELSLTVAARLGLSGSATASPEPRDWLHPSHFYIVLLGLTPPHFVELPARCSVARVARLLGGRRPRTGHRLRAYWALVLSMKTFFAVLTTGLSVQSKRRLSMLLQVAMFPLHLYAIGGEARLLHSRPCRTNMQRR